MSRPAFGTQRGRASTPTPPPPVTPSSPSLVTNPVPFMQDRVTYSVGPASASNANQSFRTVHELQTLAGNDSPPQQRNDSLWILRRLDRGQVVFDGNVPDEAEEELADRIRDHSWGFYVYVTDYSVQGKKNLPAVLEKLVQCVNCAVQDHFSHDEALYREEIFQRFKLEVVEDEESLVDASVDRIHADFLAMIRARRPDWQSLEDYLPPEPLKNQCCLVLDAKAIAHFRELPDLRPYCKMDPELRKRFSEKCLELVDGGWRRPERSHCSYRGFLEITPFDLPYVYLVIGSNGSSAAFEDNIDRYSDMACTRCEH